MKRKKNPMYYYLKKSWKLVSLVCLLLCLLSTLVTALDIVNMQLTTAVLEWELRSVFLWIGIDLLIVVATYLCTIAENILVAKTMKQMNHNVRHDLYLTLLSKSHTEYSGQDTANYQAWLTTNIKQIDQLAWSPFFSSISSITAIVTSVLALAWLHWELLLFGLISSAAMLLLPKLFTKRMEKRGKECAAAESASMVKMRDLLRGLPVLTAFGRRHRFLDDGDQASQDIENANYRMQLTQFGFGVCNGLADAIIQLANMALAVVLAFQGKILVGAFASSSNLVTNITRGITTISRARLSFASAKAYFEPISVHSGREEAPKAPVKAIKAGISLKNVNFAYTDKPVLENASFTFEKGKKYALTGASGCGKSTVLKLLLGWLPDYTGQILLDGQDAKHYTPEQLQQQMSYIEQDVFLFNTTIRENITLGEPFTEAQMQKALHDSALEGDLANMPQGLDTQVGEDGSCLSGGQKQRVAIARALIHGRSILLVDEGTSALDQKNADIVEKSLLDNPDLTLILVSHHLSAERKAQFDKVYTLEPVLSRAG